MGETARWRSFVEALASVHGMEVACLIDYDEAVAAGESPRAAAWVALFSYDALPLEYMLDPGKMEPEPDSAPQAQPPSEVRA